MLGSASAAHMTALSFAMMSTGAFFGANMPVQPLASNPGTNSPTAGTSGSAGARVAVVTAKPRSTGIARQLKVGMAPVLSRRMLLRAIPAFQERYPAIQLILLRIYESAEIGDEGID